MSIRQGNNIIAGAGEGGGSVDIDNLTITKNSSNELQTIGVINQNDTTTAIKTRTGTKAQYEAIVTKDANTLYNITDDVTGGSSVYTKSQVDTLLADKLNTSGSNATTATLKNINNAGGGTSIKCIQLLTKTAYDAIVTKDSEILYLTYEV